MLAGQRPGPDRLATHFGQDYKALVEVDGEAMVTRVIRCLHAAPDIARIIILSQAPYNLQAAVDAGGGATLIESSGGISSSIKAIAGTANAPWPVLVTTADHPLLDPAMISQFLSDSRNDDLAIAMVEKKVMLAAFPGAQRTWLKFRDGHWSGANLFALRTERVRAALDIWSAAEQDRKTVWKLFLHFGPWLALRALTRTIGLADALAQAGIRFGLSIRLVPMTDPIAAIDVDKPLDHAQAEEILRGRRAAAP